jgi:hypothetical protein
VNPFADMFWKQQGITPTQADFDRMDPQKAFGK